MKFLCLAYGSEEDWNRLSREEQEALLAQDEVVRRRGALMAAVQPAVSTVRAPDGTAAVTEGHFADARVPLAGFSIIEAADVDEVVRLVKDTPCARAGGAIEIRPILQIHEPGPGSAG